MLLHCGCNDEVCAWGKRYVTEECLDRMPRKCDIEYPQVRKGNNAPRRTVQVGNAGYDDNFLEKGICGDKVE